MAKRITDHASEIKAKIKNDLILVKNRKTWYLLDESENLEIALYSKKEMSSTLHTISFLELTEKLISAGIFTKEHYFCIQDENSYREFWTEAGLNFLKEILVISKKEEEDYVSHYYFAGDSLGEAGMFSAVTIRYNKEYILPGEEEKKENTVKNYMSGSWGSFHSKDKEDFDKYLMILYGIRRDIENGIPVTGIDKETGEKAHLKILEEIDFAEMMP